MSNLPSQISSEDSVEALRNDYYALINAFNSNIVHIDRESAPIGTMCLLKITVKAPSHILSTEDDIHPKPVNELSFRIQVMNGYPLTKPRVFYPPDHRLASVNVFRTGAQCVDEWLQYSSLVTLAEKTIRDIIHDPNVSRYESMAYSPLKVWQKTMVENGTFPTIDVNQLFKGAVNANTTIRLSGGKITSNPPLPVKKKGGIPNNGNNYKAQ